MKKYTLFLLFLVLNSTFAYCAKELKGYTNFNDVNIIDFGAKPDGETNNTMSIQNAIDHCASSGGGTVFIPAGTFLAGSLFVKSNITLNLHKLAILKGVADTIAYPGEHFREMGFIRIESVSNVTIMGEGTIDGSGEHEVFQKGNNGRSRPYLVHLRNSKNVVIKDVQLRNAAFWAVRLLDNDGVRIDGINIYSHNNWNNDGIDIDSKNVIVSNCLIDTDDDGICFKSNSTNLCENVVVTNCIIATNCNAIKFGTASFAGFKNITVSNCVIRAPSESKFRRWAVIDGVTDTLTGPGIALEIVDGGIMEQINISNITMTDTQTPIFLRLGSRRNPTGSMKNILISNIHATTRYSSRVPSCISGVPGFYIENVVIRDVIISCAGGGTTEDANRVVPENEKNYPDARMFGLTLPAYGMYIRHAKNVYLDNIQFYLSVPDYRPAILLDDAHDIKIRAFQASQPAGNQQLIVEKNSTNVKLMQ